MAWWVVSLRPNKEEVLGENNKLIEIRNVTERGNKKVAEILDKIFL